jgi:hypothetical protein
METRSRISSGVPFAGAVCAPTEPLVGARSDPVGEVPDAGLHLCRIGIIEARPRRSERVQPLRGELGVSGELLFGVVTASMPWPSHYAASGVLQTSLNLSVIC